MTNLSKGSTYSAVVPLTAMGLEPSNLFGYTKYLIWTWTWSVLIPIKLVFQWRLMFDKKLKETSLPCYLTWNLTWKSGFGPYANEHKHKLILVLVGWSGRWWKCWRDRPRTDPSSVSDFGTGLGVILVLKRLDSAQLCVETPFRPALFSVFSSINWSRLLSSGPDFVSGIEYRIEPRISTCIYSIWT